MAIDRVAWHERQQAWERFHAWEAAQPETLTPAERLARVGELLELYRKWHPEALADDEGLKALERQIQKMQAALRRTPSPDSSETGQGPKGS